MENRLKILVTGAKGFLGKNLVEQLKNLGFDDIYEFDKDDSDDDLDYFTKKCEFVYHLAGINRPQKEKEFMEGNFHFTSKLLMFLERNSNKSPIVVSSSIKAIEDTEYGKSKLAAEKVIVDYSKKVEVQTYIYRLPNLFGKWSKPNYNTVVATFCYNISRNIDILIKDANHIIQLSYIDDVVNEFISLIANKELTIKRFLTLSKVYKISLGKLAETLKSFRSIRSNLNIPDLQNELSNKLYSTYLSFLPTNNFSYELLTKKDIRGSFTEFLVTESFGQVSINVAKPGVIKGNHWHNSKNEKFLVVSGTGLIRLRLIGSAEIIEYNVSDSKLTVVDIPPGYTHSIVNTGSKDLVTVIWVNEIYDNKNPDTYYLEV